MLNSRHLKAYHIRAQKLKKELGSQREAWETVEKEYFEIEGKSRYENYNSFRQVHWQVITGKYRHLK
jgi:hypothetical protein